MRIVFHLTTVHPRCDVRIFHNECKSIAEDGKFSVSLVVADGCGSGTAEGVQIFDLGVPSQSRLLRFLLGSLRAFVFFYKVRKNAKHSFIHFHDPELLIVAFFLNAMGFKLIYDVHEDLPKQIYSKFWVPFIFRGMLSFMVSGIEYISRFYIYRYVAATVFIAKRFPADKTILLRNFPKLSDFAHIVPVSTPLLSENVSTICYVGSITEARGLFDMLDALVLLNEDYGLSVQLVLGGKFAPLELEHRAASHLGWRYVRYIGWVERKDFGSAISGCVAGLIPIHPYPNYLESYPNKMFEYMAASVPVVCSNFSLWREILGNKECVLFIRPNNPADIASAIKKIIDDRLAVGMGSIGRALVYSDFNWSSEVVKLLQIYSEDDANELL